MQIRRLMCQALIPAIVVACAAATVHAEDAAGKLDFVRDIQPIFAQHCYKCHGLHKQEGGVRWDRKANPFLPADSGDVPLVPGKPDQSALIKMVKGLGDKRMPLKAPALKPETIALLERWIQQGANWPDGVDPTYPASAKHWSFAKITKPDVPAVHDGQWVRNPVDNFVLAKLEAAGLKPSPQADRYTLIRRVSLDLTGLPPTLAEVDAFVNDKRPDAYEHLVDRLLASPAYGERWARIWLDMARYADTQGYEKDNRRPGIWRYRDWVIRAYNADMPYDQFTIDQLAGDLLPHPTEDQILATAFNRNTMTNTEGGTDNEEFRTAAVLDRVDTTGQVWMGLTVGCAKCHSHKYDPITQREYYQLCAFFNQSEDADLDSDAPRMPMPTEAERNQLDELNAKLKSLQDEKTAVTPQVKQAETAWEKSQLANPPQWTTLEPTAEHSAGGAAFKVLSDHSVLVSGPRPDKDTYTITVHTDLQHITGFRIEAIADDSLPAHGPGRADNGNFVLSELRVQARPASQADQSKTARYVRIELPGKQRILHLAEVQVYSGGRNVALHAKATQVSTDYGGDPARAVDGNTDGDFDHHSVTHCKVQDDPWWQVDLGKAQPIQRVVVFNRTDNNLQSRLSGARVELLDAEHHVVWQQTIAHGPKQSETLTLDSAVEVDFDHASASFEQGGDASNPYPKWNAASAIDHDVKGDRWGWAVSPQMGMNQSAVFEAAAPVGFAGGTTLTFTIDQKYGDHHLLGRFRISATTAAKPVRILPDDVDKILHLAADHRSDAQQRQIMAYYQGISPNDAKINQQIEKLKKQIAGVNKSVPTVPIMRELPVSKQRKTHVLVKSNFLSPGVEVHAGVPAAFNPWPKGAPENRLGLAQWIMSDDNPLTARVLVNRYWARFFGLGIVETEEDFGHQGTDPSHPKLLDWLASEEMHDLHWSRKALCKMIVMSATYRQASSTTPESRAKDPRDRLLSRGPRFRIPAEMLRDQALEASGLLSHKMYGPSVMPPQPDNVWKMVYSGDKWVTSKGEDRYRRGVYTFIRRTSPYPSMITFDGTSRETCTIRRIRTDTPLQALVMLNDPVYVEAAQAMARHILTDAPNNVEQRAALAFRLVLVRPPQPAELDRLVKLYRSELAYYKQQDQSAATQMASSEGGKMPAQSDAAELAAWTVVSNTILNLDETMTKG